MNNSFVLVQNGQLDKIKALFPSVSQKSSNNVSQQNLNRMSQIYSFNGKQGRFSLLTTAAIFQKLEIFKYLLSLPSIDINLKNNQKNSRIYTYQSTLGVLLCMAEKYNDVTLRMIEVLLNDPRTKCDGKDLLDGLHNEPMNSKVIKHFIEKTKVNITKDSLVIACQKSDDLELIKAFLKHPEVDPNSVHGVSKKNSFFAACEKNSSLIIKELLKVNNIDVTNNNTSVITCTPLYKVIEHGNIEIFTLLLKIPKIQEMIKNPKSTHVFLFAACKSGKWNMYNTLITRNEFKDAFSIPHSYLLGALTGKNSKILESVIEKGKKNMSYKGALFEAVKQKNIKIVKMILQVKGVDIGLNSFPNNNPIGHAIDTEQIEIVKELLKRKDIKLYGNGFSAISNAASGSNLKIVKLLLSSRKTLFSWGISSPLIYCISGQGNVKIFSLLLQHFKRFINEMSNLGTPLYLACQKNNEKIVFELLKYKEIDLNSGNKKGSYSALYEVCRNGNNKILKMFIAISKSNKCHAPLNILNGSSIKTPIMIACEEKKFEIVKTLIDNMEGNHYKVILTQAFERTCEMGHLDIIKLFLQRDLIFKFSTLLCNKNIQKHKEVISLLQKCQNNISKVRGDIRKQEKYYIKSFAIDYFKASICFGMEQYENEKLSPYKNAKNNAIEMHKLFERIQFDMKICVINKDLNDMIDEFDLFIINVLEEVNKEENSYKHLLFVFYFCGHSIFHKNISFFLPIDFNINLSLNQDELGSFSLHSSKIMNEVSIAFHKHKCNVVMLYDTINTSIDKDSLKEIKKRIDGKVINTNKALEDIVTRGIGNASIENEAKSINTFVCFSSNPNDEKAIPFGKQKLKDNEIHTPFTKALLHNLRKNGDLNDVLIDVCNDTMDNSNGLQCPWTNKTTSNKLLWNNNSNSKENLQKKSTMDELYDDVQRLHQIEYVDKFKSMIFNVEKNIQINNTISNIFISDLKTKNKIICKLKNSNTKEIKKLIMNEIQRKENQMNSILNQYGLNYGNYVDVDTIPREHELTIKSISYKVISRGIHITPNNFITSCTLYVPFDPRIRSSIQFKNVKPIGDLLYFEMQVESRNDIHASIGFAKPYFNKILGMHVESIGHNGFNWRTHCNSEYSKTKWDFNRPINTRKFINIGCGLDLKTGDVFFTKDGKKHQMEIFNLQDKNGYKQYIPTITFEFNKNVKLRAVLNESNFAFKIPKITGRIQELVKFHEIITLHEWKCNESEKKNNIYIHSEKDILSCWRIVQFNIDLLIVKGSDICYFEMKINSNCKSNVNIGLMKYKDLKEIGKFNGSIAYNTYHGKIYDYKCNDIDVGHLKPHEVIGFGWNLNNGLIFITKNGKILEDHVCYRNVHEWKNVLLPTIMFGIHSGMLCYFYGDHELKLSYNDLYNFSKRSLSSFKNLQRNEIIPIQTPEITQVLKMSENDYIYKLIYHSLRNDFNSFRLLLEQRHKYLSKNIGKSSAHWGNTPYTIFKFACDLGFPKILQSVLEIPEIEGIDSQLLQKDMWYWKKNALYFACRSGSFECVKILIEYGRKKGLKFDMNACLVESCEGGNINTVEYFLNMRNKVKIDINYKFLFQTALTKVCKNGNYPIFIRLLQEKEIDLNIEASPSTGTAFTVACKYGHLRIIQDLLRHPKMKLNVLTLSKAFLESTKEERTYTSIELIKRNEIDVNFGDNKKNCALFYACQFGDIVLLKELFTKNELDLRKGPMDYKGKKYPFEIAYKNGHVEVVKMLLEREGIEGKDFESFVSSCLTFNDHKMLELMLQRKITKETKEMIQNNIKSIMKENESIKMAKKYLTNPSKFRSEVKKKSKLKGIIIREFYKVAFVIGNGKYEDFSTLYMCQNDAKEMSSLFHKLKFDQVVSINNYNNIDWKKRFEKFCNELKNISLLEEHKYKTFNVVFFFAGHGISFKSVSYLLPIDFKRSYLKSKSDIEEQSMCTTYIENQICSIGKSNVSCLILDCCRSSVDEKVVASMGLNMEKIIQNEKKKKEEEEEEEERKNIVYCFATNPNAVALDDVNRDNDEEVKLKNSPFTTSLVEYLSLEGKFGDLLNKVRNKTLLLTKENQRPWITSSVSFPFMWMREKEVEHFNIQENVDVKLQIISKETKEIEDLLDNVVVYNEYDEEMDVDFVKMKNLYIKLKEKLKMSKKVLDVWISTLKRGWITQKFDNVEVMRMVNEWNKRVRGMLDVLDDPALKKDGILNFEKLKPTKSEGNLGRSFIVSMM